MKILGLAPESQIQLVVDLEVEEVKAMEHGKPVIFPPSSCHFVVDRRIGAGAVQALE